MTASTRTAQQGQTQRQNTEVRRAFWGDGNALELGRGGGHTACATEPSLYKVSAGPGWVAQWRVSSRHLRSWFDLRSDTYEKQAMSTHLNGTTTWNSKLMLFSLSPFPRSNQWKN